MALDSAAASSAAPRRLLLKQLLHARDEGGLRDAERLAADAEDDPAHEHPAEGEGRDPHGVQQLAHRREGAEEEHRARRAEGAKKR